MTQLVGPPIVAAVVASQFDDLADFYSGLFGVSPFGRDDTWVGFDIGWPGMLEILRLREDGLPQYRSGGWRIGFSAGDIERTVARLDAAGLKRPDEIRSGVHGDSWCYFEDPDGGHICVVQRGAPPERATGRPAFGSLEWSGFVTSDLQRAARYFTGALGLKFLGAGESSAWFDCGWPNLVEGIAHDPAQPQYAQLGWVPGFGVSDIAAARDEMIARGAKPVTDVLGGVKEGAYWAYFSDPEGNLFEITHPLGPPWPEAE